MPPLSLTRPAARWGVILSAQLGLGCSDPPPTERFEPMHEADRTTPPRARIPAPRTTAKTRADGGGEEAEGTAAPLPTREPIDPAIEQTLELISSSGHRFYVPDDDPDKQATEYTAEQFASMLRQKWDWVGYDLVTLVPWLDEIATSSFKTRLPYLVEVEEGQRLELRPWLDRRLEEAQIQTSLEGRPEGDRADPARGATNSEGSSKEHE